MKEKLDKTYVNIKKYDKSAALALTPSLLSLIQPQQSQLKTQPNGTNRAGDSNLQNQQLAFQNSTITSQSLSQQQQQALTQPFSSLGANDLSQLLFSNPFGLAGINYGLDKDSCLSLLHQRAALNALPLGLNYNSQTDLLKALSISQAHLGGTQSGGQLGAQLGTQLTEAFLSQLGMQLGSQLNIQLASQLGSQLGAGGLQNIGLINPQLGLSLFQGIQPEQQQKQLLMQQLPQIGKNMPAFADNGLTSSSNPMKPLSIQSSSTSDIKLNQKDEKNIVLNEGLLDQKVSTSQSHAKVPSKQAAGFAKKQHSQDNKSFQKTQSQQLPKAAPTQEETKDQPEYIKKNQKSISSDDSENNLESPKQFETALAQNEKEKMRTIQEKIQNLAYVNSNSNIAQEKEEKHASSNIQLKTGKSFQLFKGKGNSDELRSLPLKKLKSDYSLLAKSSEETSNSPSVAATIDKRDEAAENSGASKEKTSEEPLLIPTKILTMAKIVKPLVLTSPISQFKQV